MNAKKLIPLLVLLLVLVGVVFVKQSGKKEVSITEQVQLATLIDEGVSAKDIAKIELYAGAKPEEKVVLEKADDQWRVSSEFNAPAKADKMEEYLEALLRLKGEFRAKVDAEAGLSDYSLQEAEAFHVKAYKAGSTTPEIDLYFGKAAGYKSVLLRKAGDLTVYVEDTNLRQDAGVYGEEMDKAPTAATWLDTTICKLDKEAVTKVALTMPDKELVFEQVAKEVPAEEPAEEDAEESDKAEEAPKPEPKIEYEWKLASGGFLPEFKQPGLDKILQKLSNFTATKVVDPEKKAEWGLESPAFKATVSLKEGEDVVLEAGRPEASGSGYVRLAKAEDEVIYEVSKYNFEQLFPKGSELFDLPAKSLKKDAITQVEIAQKDGRVVLSQADQKWSVVEPVDALEVQETTLTTLANTLASWKPVDYADPGVDAGAFDEVMTILVGDASHSIAFGAPAKSIDGRYVKVDGGEKIFVMSQADVKKMLLLPRDVYQMALLKSVEADAVLGLDIVKDGATFSLNKAGEVWKVVTGEGEKDADAARCESLLEDLIALQASNFAADTAAGWSPQTSITIRLKEGAEKKLAISDLKEEVYYMSVAGLTSAFEAEKADIDSLRSMIELAQEEKKEEAPQAPEEEAVEATEIPADALADPVIEVKPAEAPTGNAAVEAPAIQLEAAPAAAPIIQVTPDAEAAAPPALEIEAPAVAVEAKPEAAEATPEQ